MSKVRELRDAGYLYDGTADEPELAAERAKAKDLCFEYNTQTRPSEFEKQQQIIHELLGKHGKNTFITAPFYVDYGYNIEVGDNFYANHNLVVLDPAKVRIGNNVFIASNVNITTAGHPIDAETRNKGIEYAYPVRIGDDVWIGSNVVGNPCRPIRKITAEDKNKYLVPPKCCQEQ